MSKAKKPKKAVSDDVPERLSAAGPGLPANTAQELRALDVMDIVPAGCMAVRDLEGLCEPHIKIGECAIVDTNDRQPRHGEIYLIRWSNRTMSIMQAMCRHVNFIPDPGPGWILRPMPTCRGLALADGYYRDGDYFRSRLVGRVIGVLANYSTH